MILFTCFAPLGFAGAALTAILPNGCNTALLPVGSSAAMGGACGAAAFAGRGLGSLPVLSGNMLKAGLRPAAVAAA
ncbi:hypothetical protein [Gluconacetobacter asukensis]|uniref:Uncharacterized protein n=1 Tax=Gluconacetobacter asukensis TaxID=1017181 RepID=A0A7W4J3M9_9PROT|nr:hypothetical protein [Gluconacetobacter asukensis]MBB2174110.1 hypothetical protein [Gluconacetobacter asukensis]